MNNIIIIVGTRPNFIKASSIYNELVKYFNIYIVHTGQHYDYNMSNIFFEDLKIKHPDTSLNIVSKSRADILDQYLYCNHNIFTEKIENIIDHILQSNLHDCGQLGEIILKLEKQIHLINPSLIIVFGDVTSTLAGAVCGFKMKIRIAHIEAGLRSFDITMPEEVNRYIVDSISTFKFCTEESALVNLSKENITDNVYLVGNTMIDTLYYNIQNILNKKTNLTFDCKKKDYILFTLHRQNNVDNPHILSKIIDDLIFLSKSHKIIWPIHPRTKKNLNNISVLGNIKNIILCDPLGYLDFLCLMCNSIFVLTDSGGIQEEACALRIPCFTLRKNTERPSTLLINGGTNVLINDICEIPTFSDCTDRDIMINVSDYEYANKKIRNILVNNI